MRAALLGVLLCAVKYSYGNDVARCSNSTSQNATITFSQYDEEITGRYLAVWCTKLEPNATSWRLETSFYDDNDTVHNPCLRKKDPLKIIQPGHLHSSYKEDISFDGNCSYVCLNTTVDLIFSSCYSLRAYFLKGKHLRQIKQQVLNVTNNYTREMFANNNASVDIQTSQVFTDSQLVTLVWHTGVPFTDFYDVELNRKTNLSLDISEQGGESRPQPAPRCWAGSRTEVRCRARLPPGHYHSRLGLSAPWVGGVFDKQHSITYCFNVSQPTTPRVAHSSSLWAWCLGALALALALALCACVACRRRDARALHKRVLREWLLHRSESTASPETPVSARRHILFLYAREGPVAARFCAALKAMLEEATDTKVYDIFSAEVMSQAASGPNSWIRGMLQRDDVSVLLLQTPALAALYQHQLHDQDDTVQLVGPLLGRRVLYRAPQYGDSLLQYAVSVTAEAAHAATNYHKYYLATLAELPTEMFPALVPYRRYLLPAAAALLARDLRDVTPAPRDLRDVTPAPRDLRDVTPAPRDLRDVTPAPRDLRDVTPAPRDLRDVTPAPRDLRDVTPAPRDLRDVTPAPRDLRDVTPAPRDLRDVTPAPRDLRDVTPAPRDLRDVTPAPRDLRDVTPAPRDLRDVTPAPRDLRDVTPAPRDLRDVTPAPRDLRDVTPAPRDLRDVTPAPRDLRDVTPAPRDLRDVTPAPRDLRDVTPAPRALHALALAAAEFTDLALHKPDYLMDELMLI